MKLIDLIKLVKGSSPIDLIKEFNPISFLIEDRRDKKWKIYEKDLQECFKILSCPNGKYDFFQKSEARNRTYFDKVKLKEFALKWGYVKDLFEWREEYDEFVKTQEEIWKEYWRNSDNPTLD